MDYSTVQKDSDMYWQFTLAKSSSSMLYNTFLGLLQSSIICSKCKFKSVSFESFTSIALPIKSTI